AVDVREIAGQAAGVAPELRRRAAVQRAREALRRVAGLAIELPQHVHRADEPVLVRGVELDAAAEAERRRADQRHVVEVEAGVAAALETPADLRFQEGARRLLREERRERAERRLHA